MIGEFMAWLTDPAGLSPHGFCLLWEPGLIWIHGLADIATALAYFSIPVALTLLVRRRRDLAFGWVFWLFATFIFACGMTHVLSLVTLWLPIYALEGIVKAAAAVVSVATAAVLWPLLPRAIALPSQATLHEMNATLSRQVAERDTLLTALRRSEENYRIAFEHSPVPLIALDMEGRVTRVSDEWLNLMGRKREAVIGVNVCGLLAPGTRGWAPEDLSWIVAEGDVRDLDTTFERADRSLVETQVSARVETIDGTRFISCAVVDVTARRKAEAALRESEARLRQSQKMEAIGRLTGGVAHDFNNMLMVVDSSLAVVKEKLEGGITDVSDQVNYALEASGRAARLTAQLLSFSRQQRLLPRATEPAAVIEGMRTLLSRTVGERATLLVEMPRPDSWACMADRNQLESALLNLVINARDAVSEHGTIRISSDNLSVPPMPPGSEELLVPGEYVRITVADNGTGMTDEVRRRAFEPFFTTKPLGEGTGLGLAQIYGFARQSGGTITVDTTLGMGTKISILLPRASAGMAMETMISEAPRRAGRAVAGETVLLVEDEPALLELCSDSLRKLGYNLLMASDASQAMDFLEGDQRIDVMLTDIAMPGTMDGVALSQKAMAIRPDMPVIYASGHFGGAAQAAGMPAARMLGKPFTAVEMGDAVRRTLDETRIGSMPGEASDETGKQPPAWPSGRIVVA